MDSFVLGGTEVTQRRVQAARVVPALDVLKDGASKSDSRGPRALVNELSFDGGEKRFRYRIGPRRQLHLNATEEFRPSV